LFQFIESREINRKRVSGSGMQKSKNVGTKVGDYKTECIRNLRNMNKSFIRIEFLLKLHNVELD